MARTLHTDGILVAVVIGYVDVDHPDWNERSIVKSNWIVANLIADLCVVYADDTELTEVLPRGHLFGSIDFNDMGADLAKKTTLALRHIATECLKDSPSLKLPQLESLKAKDTDKAKNTEFYLSSVKSILGYLEREAVEIWGDDFLITASVPID